MIHDYTHIPWLVYSLTHPSIILILRTGASSGVLYQMLRNKVMTVLTILFGPIGFLISMIKEVASNWGKIKEALAATGLFDKIKEIGTGIKDFIKPGIDWLISVWDTVKNAVGGFFSYIINGIKSFFEPAITWIVNAWHTATSVIGGFFKGIFDAIYTFVQPALIWFSEKWQQITAFFKDNAIVNAIKVIGGTLISGLLAPVQGLLEILSYIPGLGHLAGKGVEKIQELRNFLKGVDGATVTAEVNTAETITPELTPPTNVDALMGAPDLYPGFGIPGMGTDGGKSKLHGVIDISGGIPALNDDGTYTTTSGVDSASATGTATAALTTYVVSIANTLHKIDGAVSAIANSFAILISARSAIAAPEAATRTSLISPRLRMGGGEDVSDFYNPRDIAPITQAERMAYSYQERRETVVIEVAAEKGTAARIVRAPRDVDIRLVTSGGNR